MPIRHRTRSSKRNEKESVAVYVRLKPKDFEGQASVIQANSQQVQTVSPDGTTTFSYNFTHVFDPRSTQRDIYEMVAKPVVEDLITTGKNGLIFTYGVTSSGKTHTMEGDPRDPGLIYRTIDFLFNSVGSQQVKRGEIESNGHNGFRLCDGSIRSDQLYPNLHRSATLDTPSSKSSAILKWQKRKKEIGRVGVDPTIYYSVFVSLIELYNKQVVDLFEDFDDKVVSCRKKREIREDTNGLSYVANAVEKEVKTADETIELFLRGLKRRTVAKTALNSESSRSHCVFNIKLVQVKQDYANRYDEDSLMASQICLVDLAGSERAKRSHATGGTLHEAGNINNSLGALRKCIKALRDRDPNANPQYREYSLTRLFKSYFEGKGTVRMILCINQKADEFQENNFAMDFGVQTQDVAIDYASPPKLLKRSSHFAQDYATMYEFLKENQQSIMEINSDKTDQEFLTEWIDKLKRRRDRRKKVLDSIISAQGEVRQNIVNTMNENANLRHTERELKSLELRLKDQQFPSHVYSTKSPKIQHRSFYNEDISTASSSERISDHNPCAPHESPIYTDRHTDQNTLDDDDTLRNSLRTQTELKSPLSGLAVANPRHNRSLSTGSLQWIFHKPNGTIDTGTVFKPKFKNRKSVRVLRSSDILRKDAGGYSVVHQAADHNGDIETSVFKGQIISTVCGGAQVILNDVEKMRQVSPTKNPEPL